MRERERVRGRGRDGRCGGWAGKGVHIGCFYDDIM